MNTSPFAAKIIETKYVWGPTIESCMKKAQEMCQYGRWRIEGNPAPMTWAGTHGTGISICRENDE